MAFPRPPALLLPEAEGPFPPPRPTAPAAWLPPAVPGLPADPGPPLVLLAPSEGALEQAPFSASAEAKTSSADGERSERLMLTSRERQARAGSKHGTLIALSARSCSGLRPRQRRARRR